MEYYDSSDFSGPVTHTEVVPEMNFDFGSGNIFGTCNNDCSAKFSFIMKIPFYGHDNVSLSASTSATMNGGGYVWSSTGTSDTKSISGSTSDSYSQMTGTYTDTRDTSYLYLKYNRFGYRFIMPIWFFSCGANPDAVVEQQTVA